MRHAPRSSTVPWRALAAAALTLALVLAITVPAGAAPSLSIDPDPPTPTNNPLPLFAFTTDAPTVECSIDQGTPDWVLCPALTYAPDGPLLDGDYVFRVQATDDLLEQTEATRNFTVDTRPPSLTIDSGPPSATNDTAPSFAFTAEPGASVECSLTVDQATPDWVLCPDPTYAPDEPLRDGGYVFRLQATDAAGNTTETEQRFTVDTIAPAVGVVSGPTLTSEAMPAFGFAAEPGARTECSIDHGTPDWVLCPDPTYAPLMPLLDGDYVFNVRATDAAGNSLSDSQRFTVDSEAPTLSIVSGPAGPTRVTAPSFAFAAEPDTRLECSLTHDQATPAYSPCGSPYTSTALPDGTYTFQVKATDGAGNYAITTRTFTVDTTPPSLSIGFGPSGTTNDSTPLFGFSAEAGATVACSIDQGTPAYGACASPTTHAAVAPLADGDYVFRVRATDPAGNQTTVTRAFTVDTVPDAPAPQTSEPDPTPPPASPAPAEPLRLLSPFPLVRISGTLTASGARIRLLSVRAASGTLVRVTVSPSCGRRRRSAPRCRVVQASGTVGRRDVIAFRRVARAYRSGTVIVVRVWRADRIGKYTRFTIVRGKAPRRVDQCLVPGASRGSRCPTV